MLALQVSIVCIVFGVGLQSTGTDILFVYRHPALLVRSLLAVLVVMPLVAIGLARTLDLRHPAEVVLIALAISPVPPLFPKKTGGGQPFTISLMVTLAVAAILATPLWVAALAAVYDRPLVVTHARVAGVALTSILLPLIAGVVIRRLTPSAVRLIQPVNLTGMLLLAMAGVALLIGVGRSVWASVGEATVLALASFVLTGFAVGHLLGGPRLGDAAVLGLACACRHPVLALAIASANFPGEQFVGTLVLYLLVSALLTVGLAAWSRKQEVTAGT